MTSGGVLNVVIYKYLVPSIHVIIMKMFMFYNDLFIIISYEETFLQDFQVILKHPLQNYQKILKKLFLGATWAVLLVQITNHSILCNPLRKSKDSLKLMLQSFQGTRTLDSTIIVRSPSRITMFIFVCFVLNLIRSIL